MQYIVVSLEQESTGIISHVNKGRRILLRAINAGLLGEFPRDAQQNKVNSLRKEKLNTVQLCRKDIRVGNCHKWSNSGAS